MRPPPSSTGVNASIAYKRGDYRCSSRRPPPPGGARPPPGAAPVVEGGCGRGPLGAKSAIAEPQRRETDCALPLKDAGTAGVLAGK
jgi:hypothetical protein